MSARSNAGQAIYTSAAYRTIARYLGYPVEPGDPEADLAEILGDDPYPSVERAVARIAIERIQHRLPQWLTRNRQGELGQTRPIHPPRAGRTVLLKPIHVGYAEGFGAGPGMGWHVDYHAVWLPLFERFVVIESDDEGNDEPIGHLANLEGDDEMPVSELIDRYRADMHEDEEAIERLRELDEEE